MSLSGHPAPSWQECIIWSVMRDNDSASGTIWVAEDGKEMEGTGVLNGVDVIAMTEIEA